MTAEPHAEVLPELAALLGSDLVGAVPIGGEPTASGFLLGYALTLRGADDAVAQHVVYLETKPRTAERPGVLRFEAEDGDAVDVWLYPNDPALPALGAAVFPDAAAVLLDRLGHPIPDPSLELLAYRPGKRAVIRVTGGGREAFLKVVRPAKAGAIADTHRRWTAAGVPVPRTLGWSPEGLLVLEPLDGRTADAPLTPAARAELLDGLETLAARVSGVPSEDPARASLMDRIEWYAARLADLLPERAATIGDVARAATQRFAAAEPAAPTTIHGDLHLGQLRVAEDRPGRIVGLLDVDTAGLGDPADDAAALFAHATATAVFCSHAGDVERAAAWATLADACILRWDRVGRAYAARARSISAAHLLAHALTTAGSAPALLGLARSLLDDERPLIAVSLASHTAPEE